MGSPIQVEVSPLSDDEIATSFEVLSQSFGHDAPFVDIYFPAHDTAAGRAQGAARLAAWKRGAANSQFLKATAAAPEGAADPTQRRVVGLAIWTLMKEAPPADLAQVEDVAAVWPDRGDREFMTRLWRSYVVPRTQAIREAQGRGVYILELLAVHPGCQRLGAGKALVQWGTRAADEQGVKAIVEGTPVARRLYEQCGLRAQIEEMQFDVGDEFAGRKMPKLTFMVREPKS